MRNVKWSHLIGRDGDWAYAILCQTQILVIIHLMEDDKHFMTFGDIWPTIDDIRCISWVENNLDNRMGWFLMGFDYKQTHNQVNKSTT